MPTVFVGLSGGVDSSVAAALLQQQGYDVVGVYMKNWTQPVAGIECPWRADLADAKAVAARLDIAFKVFDFQDQYKQKVVDYLVSEYRSGRTPNPDVMCNQEIKFKLFLDTALAGGAGLIATGHYAISEQGRLRAGTDQAKDQSYFLYRVTDGALARTLMPIGRMAKPAVRALAAQLDLPTAAKRDSQGICFVGEVGIKDFLSQYVTAEPGPVVLARTGQTLGSHDGAIFYTIGQRHGLGIGGGTPYYVTGKDMAANTVYVTGEPGDLMQNADQFMITDPHWINGVPDLDRDYRVRTRYRGALLDARLVPAGRGYRVRLARPDRALSPGQSAVVYDGDHVLGGGIIAV
jgi:tRNA-uridine 2-sulfurtransferase